MKKYDAQGNTICYTYDVLHRPKGVTYPAGPNSGNTPTKILLYDSATVNGVSMAIAKGRLAEAYTCSGSCTSKITDLGFSYDERGSLKDVYESTPNSGGYYHLTAGYYANFALSSLSGLPGVPNLTYGIDGEGRYNTVTAATGQNPVTSTLYDLTNYKTTMAFGSLDSDVINYDPNTGRLSKSTFNINGQAVIDARTGMPTEHSDRLRSLILTIPRTLRHALTATMIWLESRMTVVPAPAGTRLLASTRLETWTSPERRAFNRHITKPPTGTSHFLDLPQPMISTAIY